MSAAEVMTLVGGLGLFLLGMNLMSDGIEKAPVLNFEVFWKYLPRTVL